MKQLFQLQKRLPKWRQRFVKNCLIKTRVFFVKKLKFFVVLTIRFRSYFTSMWYKQFLTNVCSDFRLLMSALAAVAGKSFNSNFYCKNLFSHRVFYITIADADIGSLKFLHTLFDKYLDHMLVKFDQNRMVGTVQNFDLFDKKWLTIFDKGLMPFWRCFFDWNNCLMLNY